MAPPPVGAVSEGGADVVVADQLGDLDADAVAVARDEDGAAAFVIDWKSDRTLNHLDVYRTQLETYLELLDAPHGLLVFTSGTYVEPVSRPARRDGRRTT